MRRANPEYIIKKTGAMKTTTKIRLFAITVLMAAIVAGTNFEASAQRRDSKNNQRETKKENKTNYKSLDKGRIDHSKNDRSDREIRSYSDTRRFEDAKKNDNHRRQVTNRHDDNHNKYQDNSKSNYNKGKYNNPVYHKPYSTNYKYAEHRNVYMHSKYGKTYRKFNSNPYVFRHNHGRYYYYDGHFCDYRPGIGYVIIDIPYLTVFNELPFRCNRVCLLGNTYYQYGNLYFQALPHGYRLVPSPVQVHISARF